MQDAEHTRHLVLRRYNAWVAQNWVPSWDYPTAWDDAILNTMGGPVRGYEVVVLWLINTPGGLWATTDSLIGLAGLYDGEDN